MDAVRGRTVSWGKITTNQMSFHGRVVSETGVSRDHTLWGAYLHIALDFYLNL